MTNGRWWWDRYITENVTSPCSNSNEKASQETSIQTTWYIAWQETIHTSPLSSVTIFQHLYCLFCDFGKNGLRSDQRLGSLNHVGYKCLIQGRHVMRLDSPLVDLHAMYLVIAWKIEGKLMSSLVRMCTWSSYGTSCSGTLRKWPSSWVMSRSTKVCALEVDSNVKTSHPSWRKGGCRLNWNSTWSGWNAI